MTPHIRLIRRVARSSSRCHYCAYPIAEFQSAYEPTVDGVALLTACSHRCAERSTTAPVELAYA